MSIASLLLSQRNRNWIERLVMIVLHVQDRSPGYNVHKTTDNYSARECETKFEWLKPIISKGQGSKLNLYDDDLASANKCLRIGTTT